MRLRGCGPLGALGIDETQLKTVVCGRPRPRRQIWTCGRSSSGCAWTSVRMFAATLALAQLYAQAVGNTYRTAG